MNIYDLSLPQLMIAPTNNNFSLIAITKPNNENPNNNTLSRIFAHRHSNHQLRKKNEAIANITYVSPASQNNKSVSSSYNPYRPNQTASFNKTNRQITAYSFKSLFKRNLRYESKTYYVGAEKRKNIRQYFSQLSQDKRKKDKKPESKTQQLKPYAIKQQLHNTNSSLTVQKLKNQSKNKQAKEYQTSIFHVRDTPIHNTHIYLFAKKKVRTQPSSQSMEKYIRNGKECVTMSKILELREHLTFKNQQSKQKLMDEIHPTIAIITTREEIGVSRHSQKSASNKKAKESMNATKCADVNKKDEQQISPWNRKNISQFQYS